MRKGIIARRALTVVLMAALFSTFLVVPIAPARAAGTGTIVFDYSHGQDNANLLNTTDLWLKNNLTQMGYTVVWAVGGINSTILQNAVGLVIGSPYNANFSTAEVTAIENWFDSGKKFLWVGYDSDFSGAYINYNCDEILEAVGSHVYGEPTSIEDPYSNCGAGYRPVANGTSTNSAVADIVNGVDKVLMHGPTLLYGSNNATAPGANKIPVALETTTIENVYPLLYYGASATIVDHDLVAPYAHNDGDTGAFVAATLELAGDSVIVVSGASPYGDYRPMYSAEYHDVALTGNTFVLNAIDYGMRTVNPPADMTMILLVGGIGVVIVVIVVAIVFMKKK